MSTLRQAHVQGYYRPLSIGFVTVVLVVIIGAVFVGWSSATITLTPLLTPVATQLNVTIGTSTDSTDPNHLVGTINITDDAATVTVTPQGDGDLVPAHATGMMTIKNSSSTNQPLAAGTRLKSTTDIIVRTDKRVDVPAGGSVEVKVVADPLGADGNIPAGRFIIVALWPGLQDKIYGELSTAMAGGLTRGAGTLALNDLTAASTKAEAELRTKTATTTPGTFVLVTPSDVVSSPKPEEPSATYDVTVKAKVMTVTYDDTQLQKIAQSELQKTVHDGLTLASMDPLELTLTSQPATDQVVFLVQAKGQQRVAENNELLRSATYAHQAKQSATDKLRGSGLFKKYQVNVSPWWRTNMPEQGERITIQALPAQP